MSATMSPTPPSSVTWLAASGSSPVADFDPMAHWHETLRDGSRVLIRPIAKDDVAIERAFIERLSPQSVEFRFLGQVKPGNDMLRRLTDIDYSREMAFVALHHEAGEKREIGVSRFIVDEDGTNCECAVAVADEWQDRGLGNLLMRHLIEVARYRGIKRMYTIESAANHQMRELAQRFGFSCQSDHDSPAEVTYSLDL